MDFSHYLQILVLGIVEGVTEFLPISSTGHLLIAEHWLGTQEPDIFNVVIQAGAILAVVFIYWHKLVTLFSHLGDPASRNYLIKIGLGFVVTMVLVLVLMVKFKLKLPESLTPVAWATFLGGLIIFAVEAYIKNRPAREGVTWFEAVLVGVGQVVAALFPGASRSGSTIMAGLAVGMKRPTVTEFSFLVGIPTMFAASAFDTLKSYKNHELSGLGHQVIIDTAIGFVVSMIVAFFVVKWLLRFVQSHTFNGFAIYRVILGGGLLIALYTGAIPDVTNEEPAKVEKQPVLAAPGTNSSTDVVPPASTSTPPVQFAPATNAPAVQQLAPATNPPPVTPISDGVNSQPIDPSSATAPMPAK